MFVGYTLFSNPFNSLYTYGVCVVNELITEAALFSAMMLGFQDYMNNDDYEPRMNYGWVIIMASLVLFYWVLATGVLKPVFYAIYEFWKKRKEMRKVHNEEE